MPTEEDDELLTPGDAPLRAAPRGFSPDQMVACEKCSRANPPTRTTCLYCAGALPWREAHADLVRPTLRRLEDWEEGFNVIFVPRERAGVGPEAYPEAAALLRLEEADLRAIIETGEALPLARAATPDEASLIGRRLGALGINVLVVPDEELGLTDRPPRRVRALELTEDALVARLTGRAEALPVSWADIELFVAGRHVVRSVEVEERRKRGSETEVIDSRELISDEMLLDTYLMQGDACLRIASSNFDFSCLGDRKGLLAAENFAALTTLLRERAIAARYDDAYRRVRKALAAVWPLAHNTESRGWRRGGIGKYSTEAVTTSDNETQFTRYSRLRHSLFRAA